jgi:hypothetical protein
MMGKVHEILLVVVFLLPFFHNTVEANLLLQNGSIDLPTKQNGITYVSWRNGQYNSPSADRSLMNLAETGADWISLLVTGYQDDVGSTDIVITLKKTPTDEDLVHVIEEAHALGLKVMLKPHVDLFDDPDHWRGQIGREFESEMGWDAWFSSYRDFIFRYAELAEAHGVDQFCTGTELVGTTHREGDWRRVIEGVRARFNGPLTYASNHGGEEVGIAWWDAVDYIGVDPYYPLTDKKDPTFEELKAGWQGRVEMLADLSATWGKQVLFTEIGYRSVDGANRHPWEFREGGAVDLEEQADAYRAIFEGVYEQPWFAGLFLWAWSTNPLEGGSLDDGYTPHGKLAEDVIREWYRAAPGEITAVLEPDPDPGRMPGSPVLHPNYPNPFNSSTEIPFDIPAGWGELEVRLELFNARGQLVRVLVNRRVGAGHYRVLWDGGNAVGQPVASGVYLCRLRWSGFSLTRSILMIK